MSGQDQLELFANRLGNERYHRLVSSLDGCAAEGATNRLLRGSEFFRTLAERQIDWLADEADFSQPSIDALLAATLADNLNREDEASVIKALRVLRQRAMLHTVWRSFTSPNGLDETLDSMTKLADFVIRCAVDYAEHAVSKRYGHAVGDDTGALQKLIVVGMGKLGGRELNLSSDIDIMFIYDETGSTQGGRTSTSNQEYFTRIAQLVIRLIDAVSVDGRVFRVDTRLMPFGDSGALVARYGSLENYYQQQIGRAHV